MGTEMNVDAERAAPCPFCSVVLKGDADFYEHPKNDCFFSEWEFDRLDVAKWNRRAAQPADVGAGELPPLPEPDVIAYANIGDNDAYSPMLVERIRLDAIAADRRHQSSMQKVHIPSKLGGTSPQAAYGVPDGWKLVPIEPTLRMREAAASFGHPDAGPNYPDGYSSQRGADAVEAYRHMLAAAPPLSSEQQAEKGEK